MDARLAGESGEGDITAVTGDARSLAVVDVGIVPGLMWTKFFWPGVGPARFSTARRECTWPNVRDRDWLYRGLETRQGGKGNRHALLLTTAISASGGGVVFVPVDQIPDGQVRRRGIQLV